MPKIPSRNESRRQLIERGTAPDFTDSKIEWRRIFAEAWGTFLLVATAMGASIGAQASPDKITYGMAVVVPGMMVMVAIYMLGEVSGAPLNPAVTMAFALRRNFPWARVPAYIGAQLSGAVAAAAFLRLIFGLAGGFGATSPGLGVGDDKALAIEALLTTGLVNTILATASGARNVGPNAAIAVGAYVALGGLWAGPLTGASMNPARSLAPDLLSGDLHGAWIYILGPLFGALIAVGFEWLLKGPPTAQGATSAQGQPKKR